MLEGVGVAGVGAGVAMNRTTLVVEAVLTVFLDVAQVHFLHILAHVFKSDGGAASISRLPDTVFGSSSDLIDMLLLECCLSQPLQLLLC